MSPCRDDTQDETNLSSQDEANHSEELSIEFQSVAGQI